MLVLSLICNIEGCKSRIDSEDMTAWENVYDVEKIVDGLWDQASRAGWTKRKMDVICAECRKGKVKQC